MRFIRTEGQDVNPYKINEKELARLYTSLAKRLNQRMVRLERAGFISKNGGAYADYNVILKKFGYNKRIREKIKDTDNWSIQTVWGIGYKFEVR